MKIGTHIAQHHANCLFMWFAMASASGNVLKSHSNKSNVHEHDSTNKAVLSDAASVHRHAKRVHSIEAIRQRFGDVLSSCSVSAPDPMDPNISKRRWEFVFAEWREALRAAAYGRPPGLQ